MKKKFRNTVFAVLILTAISVFSSAGSVFADSSLTKEALLNSSNWTNLPGYTYISGDEKGTGKYPATVTFATAEEDTGINYKSNAAGNYYKPDFSDYSGLVYNNKIDINDFSVTFSINGVGVLPGNDGWIGIGLMTKADLWNSKNDAYNRGSVLLIRRSATNEITAYVHEVTGTTNTFSGNAIGFGQLQLESVKGAWLKYSVKNNNGNYEASLSAVKQDGTVLKTNKGNKALNIAPNFPDSQAYFALSASTVNIGMIWDISIKSLNGVVAGSKADVEAKSSYAIAQEIIAVMDDLAIYDNIEPVFEGSVYAGAQLMEGSEERYSAGDTATAQDFEKFYTLMQDADNEALDEVVKVDLIGAEYFGNNKTALKSFYSDCVTLIDDEIRNREAKRLVSGLKNALDALTDYENMNENELLEARSELSFYYNRVVSNTTAKALYESDTDNVPLEDVLEMIDVTLIEMLTELKLSRYVLLGELMTAELGKISDNLSLITVANAWTFMSCAREADRIYDGLSEDFIDGLFTEGSDLKAYKNLTGRILARIDVLAADTASASEMAELEKVDSIRAQIESYPAVSGRDLMDDIFETVGDYRLLAKSRQSLITSGEFAHLSKAAKSSLSDAIANLKPVTSSNFETYDNDLMDSIGNNLLALRYFDSAAKCDNESVYTENKLLLSIYQMPITVKGYAFSEVYYTGAQIKVPIESLFTNDNSLDLVYTLTGDGIIDGSYYIFTPLQAKTYTVSIKAENTQYAQSAVKTFELKVEVLQKEPEDQKGCKSAVQTPSAVIASFLLALACVMIVLRKKAAEKNVK